jgi:hypothetical protein
MADSGSAWRPIPCTFSPFQFCRMGPAGPPSPSRILPLLAGFLLRTGSPPNIRQVKIGRFGKPKLDVFFRQDLILGMREIRLLAVNLSRYVQPIVARTNPEVAAARTLTARYQRNVRRLAGEIADRDRQSRNWTPMNDDWRRPRSAPILTPRRGEQESEQQRECIGYPR